MIDFSVIFPSRERVPLLKNILQSISDTVANPDRLEVLCAVDEDDSDSINEIYSLRKKHLWLRFAILLRQRNLSEGYYNRLAKMTVGDYIWVVNDDCVFTTKGWDQLALDHFAKVKNQYPDGIWYGRTFDTLNVDYACFPLLTRRAYNVAGWVFHPEFTGWGADINLHKIWTEIGRVVDCPMLTLNHLTHHNGTREQDFVNKRIENISRYNWHCHSGEANRIRNLMHWKLF